MLTMGMAFNLNKTSLRMVQIIKELPKLKIEHEG
jgi:hypothetical protein